MIYSFTDICVESNRLLVFQFYIRPSHPRPLGPATSRPPLIYLTETRPRPHLLSRPDPRPSLPPDPAWTHLLSPTPYPTRLPHFLSRPDSTLTTPTLP